VNITCQQSIICENLPIFDAVTACARRTNLYNESELMLVTRATAVVAETARLKGVHKFHARVRRTFWTYRLWGWNLDC